MAEIPRISRMDKWTPAEIAIWNATQEVERAGADVRLTDAVILLAAARDAVADYVDGIYRRRSVSVTPVATTDVQRSVLYGTFGVKSAKENTND